MAHSSSTSSCRAAAVCVARTGSRACCDRPHGPRGVRGSVRSVRSTGVTVSARQRAGGARVPGASAPGPVLQPPTYLPPRLGPARVARCLLRWLSAPLEGGSRYRDPPERGHVATDPSEMRQGASSASVVRRAVPTRNRSRPRRWVPDADVSRNAGSRTARPQLKPRAVGGFDRYGHPSGYPVTAGTSPRCSTWNISRPMSGLDPAPSARNYVPDDREHARCRHPGQGYSRPSWLLSAWR